MPAAKHREIFIGRAKGADIGRAIDEGRQAPRARLMLPPAPAGQTAVGIDPGKRGGLVHLGADGILATRVMPLRTDGSVDGPSVEAWLRWCAPSRVFLEAVHAMPQDARSLRRLWTFASGNAVVEDSVKRTALPLHRVDPQTWQASMLMGLPVGKRASTVSGRQRCAELWPNEPLTTGRGKVAHEGLVAAALIAAWGLYYSGVRLRSELPRGASDLL